MKHIQLTHMKAGQKGKVAEVLGGDHVRQKLMHMGIYEGREITKVGHVALRGPVTIRVGRSVVALGHGVGSKIKVTVQ